MHEQFNSNRKLLLLLAKAVSITFFIVNYGTKNTTISRMDSNGVLKYSKDLN